MKKFLLFFLFILSFSYADAQAWVYHPFPVDSAMWREKSGTIMCNCCDDYELSLTGDTIVGSYTYHKLKHTGMNHSTPNTAYVSGYFWGCWSSYPMNWTYNSHLFINSYAGAYREDTLGKKVYYIEPGKTTDTLLYDFSLSVGDTLPDQYNNSTADLAMENAVTSIDSVLVNGVYRKRFNISNVQNMPYDSNYVSIIECVGSTFGLLWYLMPIFETRGDMLCFSLKDTLAYPWGGSPCAPYNVGLEEHEEGGSIISISPNPLNDKLSVRSDVVIENLELLDLTGRHLLSLKQNTKTLDLDLSHLSRGVYFLRINDASTQKIIKQ